MPAPTTGILDNFNRANETPLSNAVGWSTGGWGSSDLLRLLANNAAATNDPTVTGDQYWTTSFNEDQEVYCTLSTMTTFAGDGAQIGARIQNVGVGTVDAYVLRAYVGVGSTGGGLPLALAGSGMRGNFVLFRFDAFSETVLASKVKTFASGDRIWLHCSGSTITAYLDAGGAGFVEEMQVTDTTITGAGFVGLAIRHQTQRVDDFGGGNL